VGGSTAKDGKFWFRNCCRTFVLVDILMGVLAMLATVFVAGKAVYHKVKGTPATETTADTTAVAEPEPGNQADEPVKVADEAAIQAAGENTTVTAPQIDSNNYMSFYGAGAVLVAAIIFFVLSKKGKKAATEQ